MEPEMGKNNVEAVCAKSAEGCLMRAGKNKKGVETLSPSAYDFAVLMIMANESYDWPPTEKQKAENVPCRVYERGQDYIADQFGYGTALTAQEVEGLDLEQVQELMERKHRNGTRVVSDSFSRLINAGLVEVVREPRSKHSANQNGAYLLLIGDELENAKVRQWWDDCVAAGWGKRRRGKRPNIIDPYAGWQLQEG